MYLRIIALAGRNSEIRQGNHSAFDLLPEVGCGWYSIPVDRECAKMRRVSCVCGTGGNS